MQYAKRPLNIEDQINKLIERGLTIHDSSLATSILSNISYYRLRAYTYPFQNNSDPNHPFIKSISFEEIISLYEFDRDLRLLVFDAVERIEIAFRTRMIYHYALTHGSHWYENKSLYRNWKYFINDITSLDKEIDRSEEEFIRHYKNKYSSPLRPPSWMSLEVATLTTLSKMYQNLIRSPEKKAISKSFGLDIYILENWMHVLSNVRNICAHHSRLYNRTLSQAIVLPSFTHGYLWIENDNIDNAKMYAVLCSIVFLLDRINEQNKFRVKLIDLFARHQMVQPLLLNFPTNWNDKPFWA